MRGQEAANVSRSREAGSAQEFRARKRRNRGFVSGIRGIFSLPMFRKHAVSDSVMDRSSVGFGFIIQTFRLRLLWMDIEMLSCCAHPSVHV